MTHSHNNDEVSPASQTYPLLDKIESPDDLRKLDISLLPQLCNELRSFLIATLSQNPGHFASSMGAIELTVALHYVFDTPNDRLVWDVGHQAYAHKVLTGRRKTFSTLRTFNGLSGFPIPEESPYDSFTAGHASNSISAALGFDVASRLKGEYPPKSTVAIIGDASISGGLAFEGINNTANTANNLLIVLNDNDMSIDRNVGALSRYLTTIHASKSYNAFRYSLYKFFKKLHLVNDRKRGVITRFNNSLKSVITNEQNMFEGLNIRYFGPFDGHDVIRLVKVFRDIKEMTGPKILHLRTIKGKGFDAAEKDPANWHAPGKFNPENGQRAADNNCCAKLKFQDVFGNTLLNLARTDERIVAITAAMLSGTSVSVMENDFPDRVFDVGISEGHGVTFAGGLAKEGLRPVVAIYSSFLQRAYDHIIHDVAIQHLPVIFAIDRAGLVGEDGVTHHGSNDISYLRSVPDMVIAAPRDGKTLEILMQVAHGYTDGAFAIRYPRGGWKPNLPEPGKGYGAIGRGELISEGDDIAFLALGSMVPNAIDAAQILKGQNIAAAVYDMVYAKPIDSAILCKLGEKSTPIIVLEDGTTIGGLGSAVVEWLTDNGYTNHVKRIGIPDRFVKHGTIEELQKVCGMDTDSIVETAKTLISSK